jgi:ATP-binding cassette subfamily B protein
MLAALATMAVYDWRLTLVAVATVLPIVPVLRVMQRKVVAAWDAMRTRVGEMLAAISESIQGAAVIRAYGAQAEAQRRVMAAVERRRRAEVRAGTIGALFFPSGELFAVLTTAAVLVAGLAIGPGGGLTAGTLVAFVFLVAIFLEPVAEFTEILDMIQQAVAGWKKVLDVLDTPVEVEDPRPGLTCQTGGSGGPPGWSPGQSGPGDRAGPGVVRLPRRPAGADRGVGHDPRRHPGRPGRGHRLGQDHPGQAAHPAGRPDRRVDPGRRRRPPPGQPGLAPLLAGDGPQDGFLFDTGVADNVRMGRPEADDREIRAAFEALGLGGWVDGLPRGIRTRVGERGEHLSVGERQLVALARGYLADPGCLILDEATSAVDPATEVQLRNAIQRLAEGRTALTIAHRLATAEHADLILVLERGRLVQRGTHAQLLADAGGAYARLHGSWLASLEAGGPVIGSKA